MAAHQRQATLLRERDQLLRQRRRRRERLLHERMLARFKTAARQLIVGEHRGREENSVQVLVREDLIEILRELHARVAPAKPLEPRDIGVTDPPHHHIGPLDQDPEQVRSPVAESDHGNRWLDAQTPDPLSHATVPH